MSDLYTTISLTGAVATLLNRDAMLFASASSGATVLNIGDAYMDRGTDTKVVFPTGATLSVGTENITVSSIQSSTTIVITPALSNGYPIYTPVLRTDYFDVATSFPTLTVPGSIRVGMEDVTFSSIDVASTYLRHWILSRGENAYPHTEWAPVTDAAFSVNDPATDSHIARYGVIEEVDYHHGAMDQNTLDLYAYEKLMAATRPEYGKVTITGMDVWQDAPYQHMKTLTVKLPSTETPDGGVSFSVYKTDGTDTATTVYVGATAITDTWWDMRFSYPTDEKKFIDHTTTTFSTVGATVTVHVKNIDVEPITETIAIYDTFDDGSIDPAWDVSGVTSAVESGGSLKITESSGEWGNWDNAVTRDVSITGDFVASAIISISTGAIISGVYFEVVSQSGDTAFGGLHDAWADKKPEFHAKVTGGVEYTSGMGTRPANWSGTITIKRSGTTVSVYENQTLRASGTISDTITTVKLVQFNYYPTYPITVKWNSIKITEQFYRSATINFYYGSPLAIDRGMPRVDNETALEPLGWSSVSTGPFDIGDRGFATVREGDVVTIVELDGATRDYRVSGMIYDQRAGKLTMEIGKPQEYALTDMVKPFRTRDILSTKNL